MDRYKLKAMEELLNDPNMTIQDDGRVLRFYKDGIHESSLIEFRLKNKDKIYVYDSGIDEGNTMYFDSRDSYYSKDYVNIFMEKI